MIKFRVWSNGLNDFAPIECIFGFICDIPQGTTHEIESNPYYDDGLVVEQFSGLLDSHGCEIYEGDVVGHYGNGIYTMYTAQFPFHHLPGSGIGTILGNIHENPGLESFMYS